MNNSVLYKRLPEEGLAILCVNRPEASNAVSTAVIEGLASGLQQAKEDADVRILLITGAGERAFLAGGDLKEFHSALTNEETVYEKMSQMRRVLETIVTFPKPVIAAVNGAARGGGGEVAAACHFRIGAEHATVGYVQVKLGLSPGWGGGALLSRIVGPQKAKWMLLSGEVMNAVALQESGFFDAVAPSEQFLDHAKQFAKRLANNPAPAVEALVKKLQAPDLDALFAEMEQESRLCAQLWMTPEHIESVERFLTRGKKE